MSYYVTRKSFQIDPRYIDAPQINLGDGVDMQDPLRPAKSTYTAFKPESKMGEGMKGLGLPVPSQSIINETIVFKESLSIKEESDTLNQYFKASYGLSNISQSFERAKEEHNEFHTIYALLEYSGITRQLEAPDWGERNPELETVSDPKRDLDLFLGRYGSHYVSAIKYGLRIGIQAKLRKSESKDSTALSVDFKAAFGSFGAGGGARMAHAKKLAEKGVDILFEATSGGRTDKGLVAVRDFEGINRFLDEISSDPPKIEFLVAPIQVTLMRYWETLHRDWKNLQQLLAPNDQNTKVPDAQYGVPKGAIIPWYPSGLYLEGLEDESKNIKIIPPDGWAICDGNMDTPDLSNFFIRGTDKYGNLGQSGGAVEHSHGGNTGVPSMTQGIPKGGADHHLPVQYHTHGISKDEHLPPYKWLVYIMKL